MSCVLFVEPAPDLNDTCHFAGEYATCGSCLASQCRAFVDRCCSDGACRNEVADIDGCATSGGAACRAVAFPSSKSVASDQLAACLLDTCDAACGTPSMLGAPGETPAAATTCTVPSNGTSCRCTAAATGGDSTTCASSTIPNALCCADLDWPLAGTRCDCRTVACETTESGKGCRCSRTSSGPLTSCSTGGSCCMGGGSCECGGATNLCALLPGTGGYAGVAQCGRSTVSCGSTAKAVSRCSAK